LVTATPLHSSEAAARAGSEMMARRHSDLMGRTPSGASGERGYRADKGLLSIGRFPEESLGRFLNEAAGQASVRSL
jgi:hypothetical protein